MNCLACCYIRGLGTAVNEKIAFEYCKKANDLDKTNSGSLYLLGYCYLNGIGTEVDKEKAKEMLQKALELAPDFEGVKELLAECEE